MARIEDYALVGDLQTAALITLINRADSVDWLCLPPRGHAPDMVRIVEGVSGKVPMNCELTLRFDYGRVRPWVRHESEQMLAVAGPDAVRLRTPVPTRGQDWSTVAEFTVSAGDRVPFVLTWSPSHEPRSKTVDADGALQDTLEYWAEWGRRGHDVAGPYRDAVKRSLLTLKALTYQPTGGIVAAATTSLPEQLGGPRNWDYRYCWLRDSTYTLQALLAGGYLDEAKAWRDWLLRAVAGDPADLQIRYGVDGTRRLPESEPDWLCGYANSSPVRVGNAAAGQLELDVWGETLDGLALAREAGLAPTESAWDLQVALMEHLESVWDQPDNGLWEVRGPRRHFTHSKVMAWVAADRMVKAVRRHPTLHGSADRWAALRDTIHADVLAHGFDPDRNTFVQSYGATALDASLLMIPRVGFLPGDDPRVVGTIDAIDKELTQDGFVLRYQTSDSDDGLPGAEGLFLACSFWMVDALQMAGRQQEATGLFERLLELRNDVGLLSEEWDPVHRRQLGNTPQAFSHFALVTSGLQSHAGRGHGSHEPIRHTGAAAS